MSRRQFVPLTLALSLLACGGGDDASNGRGAGGSTGTGGASSGTGGSNAGAGGASAGTGGATGGGGTTSSGGTAGTGGGSAGTGGGEIPGPLYVRGVELDTNQEKWVRHIGKKIVPALPGTRAKRIEKASVVGWWSLKEGVLDLDNPLSYSNCSFPPDKRIGPLEVCPNPDHAWQVGISGVQAAWRTLESVETLTKSVHPGQSIAEVLGDAATTAGYPTSGATGQAIVAATGRLRLSWLLRDGAVGFEAEYPVVVGDCFSGTADSWCFSAKWSPSSDFAPDASGAQSAIDDLAKLFDQLAP